MSSAWNEAKEIRSRDKKSANSEAGNSAVKGAERTSLRGFTCGSRSPGVQRRFVGSVFPTRSIVSDHSPQTGLYTPVFAPQAAVATASNRFGSRSRNLPHAALPLKRIPDHPLPRTQCRASASPTVVPL